MKSLLLFLTVFLAVCCTSKNTTFLYVGTYTTSDSEGIYRYEYNSKDGALQFMDVIPNKQNPSFIAFHPDFPVLYAVSEVRESYQIDSGSVTSYHLNNKAFEKINQKATLGDHPCHVCVSPNGKYVSATNYTSGSISIFEVLPDGGLSDVIQVIKHHGCGPDTVRQNGPHSHSSQFSADSKLLIAADLGTDKLYFYSFSDDRVCFVSAQEPVLFPQGSGPRHFDFSVDQRFIYVMNELSSTVSVVEKVNGIYKLGMTVSSLPADYEQVSYGADVHLSQDGRFVYCSNRGHNSIAIFSRDMLTGSIKLIGHEPIQGDWPRNFSISPDGKFLLVGNQQSNNITIFTIKENGLLSFTHKSFSVPSPACLIFQ